MKNFIEVTDQSQGKVLLNTAHIYKVALEGDMTHIALSVYNAGSRTKTYFVLENYETVRRLIAEAQQ
ncbi:MAG: hypothetical protein LBR48_01895 [Dysgonamonadaceae bacterium]|jgi:hypothetical protein|nr:hypothetical protein [Dysgonamonadaceae bacterium]